MRTSAPYPCGCVVVRNDDGVAHDVIRCHQHQNEKNLHRLLGALSVHPVLDVHISEPVKAQDRMGR